MSGKVIAGRAVGEEKKSGPPLMVGGCTIALTCPTIWYDKQGDPHQEMIFLMPDGTAYRDPNGEAFSERLAPFTPEMSKQFQAQARKALTELLRPVVEEIMQGTAAPFDNKGAFGAFADEVDSDVTSTTS